MGLWGGAFPRWLGHEGGALMNRVSALIKEAPDRTLSPSALWGYGVHLWVSRTSSDTESASTIIIDFLAPRNVRNKYVLLISHSIYGSFVLVAYSLNRLGFPGGSAVKTLPKMQKMQVWSLGLEDPLEK